MKFIKKKWKKIVGSLLVLLSLYFVINRLISFDIDYMSLLSFKNILFIILFSFLYALPVFLAGYPWKKLINLFTKKEISYDEVSNLWTKTNILKYLPGNVFQYVGRNQIAIKYKLNHLHVFTCTFLEVLFNVMGTFILGIILYFPGFVIYWEKYFKNYIHNNYLFIFIVLLLIIILVIILYKFSIKQKEFIKEIFNPKNYKMYLFCVMYYAIISLYTSLIYIAIVVFMLNEPISFSNLLIVMGAFLLSWIVGFITPGAPGGIGVRELALTLILAPIVDLEIFLLAIIVYRIVNICGDCIGVLYSNVYSKYIVKN